MKRRILALITAFVMVVTMLPASAFAEGTGEGADGTESGGTPVTGTTVEIASDTDLVKAIREQADNQTWVFKKGGVYDVNTKEDDGRYKTDQIAGGSAFVFPIWADNITITKDASAGDVIVTSSVEAPAESGGVWDWQNFITVAGNNVTIDGINIEANYNGYYEGVNKAIEIVGTSQNFRLLNSDILPVKSSTEGRTFGGSIYIGVANPGNLLIENVNMDAWISAKSVTSGNVKINNVAQDFTNSVYAGYSYEGSGYAWNPGVSGTYDGIKVDGLTIKADGKTKFNEQIFNAGMRNGTTVQLTGDVEIDKMLNIEKEKVVLDLNSHSITGSASFSGAENNNHVVNVTGKDITVKNGTIATGVNNKHALNIWNAENCKIENMILDHTTAIKGAPLVINSSDITVSGTFKTITGANSWYAVNVDSKTESKNATLKFEEGTVVDFEGINSNGICLEKSVDGSQKTTVDFGKGVKIEAPAVTKVVYKGEGTSADSVTISNPGNAGLGNPDENGDYITSVAYIGKKGYATLQEAIDAAEEGETVVLNKDVYGNFDIAESKDFILDLNGNTIDGMTTASKAAITNNGTVKIISSNGTGIIKRSDYPGAPAGSYYTIKNEGNMTIEEGVKVYNNAGKPYPEWSGSSLICNGASKEAKLVINGGEFGQDNFIVVKNDEHGILEINGGIITSKTQAVQNWNNAYIIGGNLTGDVTTWTYKDDKTDNETDAVTEISGGIINGNVESFKYCYGSGDAIYEPESKPEVIISGDAYVKGDIFVGIKDERNGENKAVEDINEGKLTITSGTFEHGKYDAQKKYFANVDESIVAKGNTYYVGGEATDVLKGLKDGDTIEIVKNIKSVEVPEGVTVTNSTGAPITVNGETVANGESITVKPEPPVIVYPVISRIAAIADQEYTGSAITPALTVYDTDGNIISSNNYTATYTNNVEPGTATVTVTGKAGVMGSATATFTIVKKEDPQPPQPEKPGKVKITKSSSDFGRIRVYFDKVAAVGDNTMRYQIQSQKVGSDVVKTQYATVGYAYATVRDLAYNAKYNIKIRAYYVDENGERIYGDWSEVKSVYANRLGTANQVMYKAGITKLTAGKTSVAVDLKKVAFTKNPVKITYQIAYKKQGATKFSYAYTTNVKKTVYNLSKNTNYQFKVRYYYKSLVDDKLVFSPYTALKKVKTAR